MAGDALEPGPLGNYPYFPRTSEGVPLWSVYPETDNKAVNGRTPMPRGIRPMRDPRGRTIFIDVTPRGPGGVPIDPPIIAP